MMEIVIFDTETTGLLKPLNAPLGTQPRIIEFFGVKLNEEFEIIKEHHVMIDPEEPLSKIINRVTGIYDKDLAGKPKFRDVSEGIHEFMEGSDLRVAHNIDFDNGMIENEFKRLGIDAPTSAHHLCTVRGSMHIMGFRLSLTRLHQILFKKPFKAHRAKDDVYALTRCFHRLVEDGRIKLADYE